MQKMLNTISANTIIESISYICNCDKSKIIDYIKNSKLESVRNLDDINLEYFFEKIGLKFKNKLELYELIKFDFYVISHLTTRLSSPNKDNIYPLTDCLINKTDLSIFFAQEGLTFKKYGEEILTYINDDLINWNEYKAPKVYRYAPSLISKRLKEDKCINGFLINENFWKDRRIEHLYDCPEIMKNIFDTLNMSNSLNKWKRKSKCYSLSLKCNIKDIVIENYLDECKSIKSKIYLIYKFIIQYLIKNNHNTWDSRFDNKIIRLKDNLSINKKEIIDFYEIKK